MIQSLIYNMITTCKKIGRTEKSRQFSFVFVEAHHAVWRIHLRACVLGSGELNVWKPKRLGLGVWVSRISFCDHMSREAYQS